ncbi:MAG: glycogen/starch/alpha-glucan phosphorylase [Clostridiaceae bacterium]|nr:glycogen/starch/alpha-glucan phosphorylase [Clostridiaceae bacterium]
MITSGQIKEKIIAHLRAGAASSPAQATQLEFWQALSRTLMELLSDRWEASGKRYQTGRQTHYFSAEFLEGRSLLNNLINLELYEPVREAVQAMGFDLNQIEEQETDPGLGNGGLGRLAACFLDSSATMDLPVTGYGILYRYGLFRQEIENGFQKEYPDAWMERDYPFLIRREQARVRVHYQDMDVFAVPYDMPITGYKTDNINTLRLWKAEPAQEFDFNLFNAQRFDDAVVKRNHVDDIYRVLYPNDTSYDGKVLRVRQQYFFVSASLQNILTAYKQQHGQDLSRFAEMNSIQLNDTHPVIAIPELLRLLTQEEGMAWEQAWKICQAVFAYTNHTIMAEALEKWDIAIFQFLFPWLLEIIQRIDSQFRQEALARGVNTDRINYLAPIGDGKIRMAWMAVYGSHSINGVAAMHTQILQRETLREFYQLWPERFSNKTNGVTPRRWLRVCNPELSALLTELAGSDAWVTDLDRLAALEPYRENDDIMRRLITIKRHNKERLAAYLAETEKVEIDPASIFDVQVKRLHEYKRQLLNALAILDQYYQIKDQPDRVFTPCTYLFGAKAAPGYFRAKAIIKFINEIAKLVNRDPQVSRQIKVVFIHNYSISRAERIFPAADVSEQISTVGLEASGTGNMKFMMNGALTLGTCDGANVEISDDVGAGNAYLFGCRVEDFPQTKGYYNPQWQYQNIPGLRRCVDALINGTLNDGGTGMFQDLYNSLLYGSNWQPADPYYVLGDFDEFRHTRYRLQDDYRDELTWARKCWTNIVRSGRFSSDRTIREYASDIWHLQPVPVDPDRS